VTPGDDRVQSAVRPEERGTKGRPCICDRYIVFISSHSAVILRMQVPLRVASWRNKQ